MYINSRKILAGEPKLEEPLGWSSHWWKDIIRMDFQRSGGKDLCDPGKVH